MASRLIRAVLLVTGFLLLLVMTCVVALWVEFEIFVHWPYS